jgi:hypothetical protein
MGYRIGAIRCVFLRVDASYRIGRMAPLGTKNPRAPRSHETPRLLRLGYTAVIVVLGLLILLTTASLLVFPPTTDGRDASWKEVLPLIGVFAVFSAFFVPVIAYMLRDIRRLLKGDLPDEDSRLIERP